MANKNGHGGVRPGSGRKSKAEELGLAELLNDAWPPDKQRACIRKLAQDAVSPMAAVRHPARLMLFSYAFGKPKERHEVEHAGEIVQIVEVMFTKADDGE